MKALVLIGKNKFEYCDVQKPEPGTDDVLVRVKACAICGSDVHGMDGSSGRRIPPIIMGHEASGIIEQTGENVTKWHKGDRVTFDSTVSCGSCYFCRKGKVNLCDNRRVLGVSCDEYRRDGAMAEYVVMPQSILYGLPDNITYEHAAMVEPLSVAFHALGNTNLNLNDTVVVVGVGMIGVLLVQLLKLVRCGKIIVADLDRGRLDMALRYGADIALKSDECNVAAEVMRLTINRGADAAFEAVGITPTLQTAISSTRKGGSITMVGNVAESVEFPLQFAVTREMKFIGTCASAGEYEDCLDLLSKNKITVDPFISAIAPLKEGGLWFDRLYRAERGLMKVILKP